MFVIVGRLKVFFFLNASTHNSIRCPTCLHPSDLMHSFIYSLCLLHFFLFTTYQQFSGYFTVSSSVSVFPHCHCIVTSSCIISNIQLKRCTDDKDAAAQHTQTSTGKKRGRPQRQRVIDRKQECQ